MDGKDFSIRLFFFLYRLFFKNRDEIFAQDSNKQCSYLLMLSNGRTK